MSTFVFLPDDGEEKGAGAVHDCYVGESPIAIVLNQRFDYELEERVVRDGAHGVVGDASGVGATYPGGVGKEGIETSVAALGNKLMINKNSLPFGNWGESMRPGKARRLTSSRSMYIPPK